MNEVNYLYNVITAQSLDQALKIRHLYCLQLTIHAALIFVNEQKWKLLSCVLDHIFFSTENANFFFLQRDLNYALPSHQFIPLMLLSFVLLTSNEICTINIIQSPTLYLVCNVFLLQKELERYIPVLP